ncbi:MAG: penicillin-insensitive murein endopeptidase [Enhygromyxa sp.]
MRSIRWTRWVGISLTTALASASAPAQADEQTHVVALGDTLWDLAAQHGCTVAQLRETNRLAQGDALRLGRTITIPQCGVPQREHEVVAGETLEKIAHAHATTVAELRALNELEGSLIRVGQRLKLPPPPPPKTGQSRGRVDQGSLAQPDQLPESRAYHLRRPPRTFATAHLIEHTQRAVEAVHALGIAKHELAIGDLSDQDGGPLEGHRTHQSGRDVDLGFYFVQRPKDYPEQFVEGSADKLDVDATWALLEHLVLTADQPGGVELIYLDYDIQRLLYPAAQRDGWTAEELGRVFEYPDGRKAPGRIVRHLWNHHDHLHVRFRCPPGDGGCK